MPSTSASRVRAALAMCVGLVLGTGCANAPSAPDASALVGRWTTARVMLKPAGAGELQHHLTFTADGRFVAETRMYGGQSSQAVDELSFSARTAGTFVATRGRLTFAPETLVTWDRFYGATSPERIQSPYPYTGFYDDTRFRVRGDELRLDFTTYPTDAAVPTTQVFGRDP